jgi:hypothetical protein
MSDIYRNAEEVVVWLGAKHEHMDKAIDQILELGPASYLSSMPKYRMCEHNRYRNQGYVEEAFDSLHKFIDSAWFQRLWVIQEITLSRRAYLQCGDRCISWEDFSSFTSWLFRHKDCCTAQFPSSDAFTITKCRLRTETIYDSKPYSCSQAYT